MAQTLRSALYPNQSAAQSGQALYPLATPAPAPADVYGNGTDSFTQGALNGLRGVKSSVAALYGTGAEAFGADEQAANARAYADEQNKQIVQDSVNVPHYSDVHDFSSGAKFAANAAGSALPYMVGGVGAPLAARLAGAGARGAYLTGMGANILPMAGQEAQRLQDDPTTAALPGMQKLGTSLGVGGAQAGTFEVIPHVLGQRSVGAVGHAVEPSMNPLTTVGRVAGDTALGSAGMGGASVANEALAQGVQTQLNPNRDTSHDNDALAESGVGGALSMVPFAGAHAALAHTAGAYRAPVESAARRMGGTLGTAGDVLSNTAAQAHAEAPDALEAVKQAGSEIADRAKELGPADLGHFAAEAVNKAGDVKDTLNGMLNDRLAGSTANADARKVADDFMSGRVDAQTAQAALDKADQVNATAKSNAFDRLKSKLEDVSIATGKAASDAMNAWDGVRKNAQLVDGELPQLQSFHEVFADTLAKHVIKGAASNARIDAIAPHIMKWIENGFSAKPDGPLFVPQEFGSVVKDPGVVFTELHNLMQREGMLNGEHSDKLDRVLKVIQERDDQGAVVKNNLTATAQASFGFKKADHAEIAAHIEQMIRTGDFKEHELEILFGKNKQLVLDTLQKGMSREKLTNQKDEKGVSESDGPNADDAERASRQEEIGGMTHAIDPNTLAGEVSWHGTYDTRNPNAAQGINDKVAALRTLGIDAHKIGIIDHLREVHRGDPVALDAAIKEVVAQHAGSLTPNEVLKPDVSINKHIQRVRAEFANDQRTPHDIPDHELDNVQPKSTWGMEAGKDKKYGGVDNGRLWFERQNSHGTIDKETGEVRPTLFNTSAAKLIQRMSRANKESGIEQKPGILGAHDLLMQGITSMLNSPRLTGRVGYMRNGHIEWQTHEGAATMESRADTTGMDRDQRVAHSKSEGDKVDPNRKASLESESFRTTREALRTEQKRALPADFKLPGGTVADYHTERQRAYVRALRDDMRQWGRDAEASGFATTEYGRELAEGVRQALKDNNVQALEYLRSELIKDVHGEESTDAESTTGNKSRIAGLQNKYSEAVAAWHEAGGKRSGKPKPKPAPTAELVTGESARAKADADAEESQARAHSLMNPPRSWRQSTEPEVDPENPDLGPQTAWYNESDPTQKHFGGAPVAARPVDKPPNEYADFKAGYAKAHPEATPDQVVSAFSTKSQKTTIEDQYSDAVADAFDRGADPSKDPKVAQLAAAIQERMRTPAPKVPAKDDKYIEIMSKPAEQRTPEELAYAKGYDKWVDKTKVQPGVTRMEVLATTRPVAMLDTKNGNSPVTINVDELNRAFREEPGRYVTGGAGAAALKPTALLEDIRGGIQQVRTSLQSLPPFSLTDRAKIALALRSRDPRGTINALVSGGAADSLTDAQQNYLINTLNLIENIMAMRSTLGAGQGSDDMRAAITATIPGPQTPSRDFGLKQLDVAEKTLDRLARGIPNVKLKGDDPQAATEAQKPVVQHSPSTGAYRYSTDGGKTWLPGQPPK